MRWLATSFTLLFAFAGSQAQTETEFACERYVAPIATVAFQTPAKQYPIAIDTPEQLVRLKESQLMQIYQSAEAGPIPTGYTPGLAILKPGTSTTVPMSRIIRATAWQGKYFPDSSTMINRTFGFKSIKATVYPGNSWLDGGPSTILDYYDSGKIVKRYRDEIREVSPGIYLGIMYQRNGACPKIAAWFALDARTGEGCCVGK